MKPILHKTAKAKRAKQPETKANAILPPDDPLRRGQQESDLNTRVLLNKSRNIIIFGGTGIWLREFARRVSL